MTKRRYLTKSRFKLAMECPAKLFYTGKAEYANQKLDDSFLAALADGGFQVGELAKCYFPGGHDVKTSNSEGAIAETTRLLDRDEVTIFEAAIATDKYLIRVDVLVKEGSRIRLYEVKAKSFDPTEMNPFLTKKGSIQSGWKSYLQDVAFQKFVINEALPQYEVSVFLMMADKSVACPTNGLNQKFRLAKDEDGRKGVSLSVSLTAADLEPQLLCKINVDHECREIYSETYQIGDQMLSFVECVKIFADHYAADVKISAPVSKACGACEFYAKRADEHAGLKSGKKECWKAELGWRDEDFDQPTIFDVWNFRRKDKLIEDGCIKMSDIELDDAGPISDGKPGVSVSERQWLQIEKSQNHDDSIWLDTGGLRREMDSWRYPLHFIDFETTTVAIPFNAGRRPYEGIAFQFSHHVVYQDGTVEHAGQYLNTESGVFPNYDFVRELKAQLSQDEGSIFRYSNHENSFLNMIYRQLQEDPDVIPDRDELCAFIRTITQSVRDAADGWVGERNMIDMWEIVKRFYYDPATGGSNSIKQVLPAILNSSAVLKEKYAQPIYGAKDGIRSLNFCDWRWIRIEDGRVVDPYKLLPKMFQDVDEKNLHILSHGDELRDGGAALTAYARMQFTEMTDYERQELREALLKYCELDTMAMVMIHEGWQDLLALYDRQAHVR